jgi:hypothetical protein
LGNLKSFQTRFIALRQQIVADGKRNGVPFHDKDLHNLLERVEKEGTSFVQVTLPLLGRALDRGLVTGQFNCPANFAMKRESRLPRLFYSVFQTVFNNEGTIISEPFIPSISYLRQMLLLDAKLITQPSAKQQESAFQGFVERQERLRNLSFPIDHPVVRRAQWLLGEVLHRLDLSTIEPGHGPGSVAEKLTREERWDFRTWPLKAERQYPYVVYGTPSIRASLERGSGVPLLKTMTTRCCLVPKDFRGPRLISAEPTVNQYLQQGQMKAIMQYVDRHPILGRSIKLRDQTHNQRMAKRAYANGLVTLDLSDASDTVSTVLVWYLLARVPKLRRQLMSTRSDYLSYEGKKVKIVAFAPMGSAVCFPVESLVFWALSMASLGHVRSLSGFPDERESLAFDIAVFGDDIIIPEDALSTLLTTLSAVGCSPNMSKTCYATPFRESCGTEWHNGIDVTIIRNRRYHYDAEKNISDYPGLLELQRKFFLRGMFSSAKLCEEWAREIYPVLTIPISVFPCVASRRLGDGVTKVRVIDELIRATRGQYRCKLLSSLFARADYHLFGGDDADAYFNRQSFASDSYPVAIGWSGSACTSLPTRWNSAYQRLEFRVPVLHQQSMNWKSEGYSRLFARLSSDSTDRFVNRDRKIKMTWVYHPYPIEAFTSRGS